MTRKRSSSMGAALFMVGAVVFAALGGVLLSRLLARQYPQESVQPIIVAARDIAPGRPLVAADLRQARWPQSSIPRGSFVAPKQVISLDAVLLAPLLKGEAVLATHLSPPRSGIGVAAKLEPGLRAVAFHTDDSVTLAQLIYPGARVDLLTTMRPGGSARRDEVKTRVLLQNVRVLAVGAEIDPVSHYRRGPRAARGGLAAIGSTSEARRALRVVTVAATTEQAERIVLATREGKIDVVLRSPRDSSTVETSGVTVAEVLGEKQGQAVEPAQAPKTASPDPAEPSKSTARPRKRRPPPRRKPVAPPPPPGPTIFRGGGQ